MLRHVTFSRAFDAAVIRCTVEFEDGSRTRFETIESRSGTAEYGYHYQGMTYRIIIDWSAGTVSARAPRGRRSFLRDNAWARHGVFRVRRQNRVDPASYTDFPSEINVNLIDTEPRLRGLDNTASGADWGAAFRESYDEALRAYTEQLIYGSATAVMQYGTKDSVKKQFGYLPKAIKRDLPEWF